MTLRVDVEASSGVYETVKTWTKVAYDIPLNGTRYFDIVIDASGSDYRTDFAMGNTILFYYNETLELKGIILKRSHTSTGQLRLEGIGYMERKLQQSLCAEQVFSSTDTSGVASSETNNLLSLTASITAGTIADQTVNDFRTDANQTLLAGLDRLCELTGQDWHSDDANDELDISDHLGVSTSVLTLVDGVEVKNVFDEEDDSKKVTKVTVIGKGFGANQILASSAVETDTFEDGNYTSGPVWTIEDSAGGAPTVVAGAAKAGSYGFRFTGDGGGSLRASTPASFDSLDTWAWVKASDVSDSWAAEYIFRNNVNGAIAQFQIKNGDINYRTDGGLIAFTHTPVNNTWYGFRIKYVKATSKVSYYLYDTNGSLLESHVEQTSALSDSVVTVALQIADTSSVTDFDFVGYGNVAPPPNTTVGWSQGDAEMTVVDKSITSTTEASELAAKLYSVHSATRNSYSFEVMDPYLSFSLGDVVTLDAPRIGLSATDVRVVKYKRASVPGEQKLYLEVRGTGEREAAEDKYKIDAAGKRAHQESQTMSQPTGNLSGTATHAHDVIAHTSANNPVSATASRSSNVANVSLPSNGTYVDVGNIDVSGDSDGDMALVHVWIENQEDTSGDDDDSLSHKCRIEHNSVVYTYPYTQSYDASNAVLRACTHFMFLIPLKPTASANINVDVGGDSLQDFNYDVTVVTVVWVLGRHTHSISTITDGAASEVAPLSGSAE